MATRRIISNCSLTLALLIAITGTTLAQVGVKVGADRTATNRTVTHSEHGWKASELIGLDVYTGGDDAKGEIEDLLIGADGKVKYAVVSFGGFLGIGDKLFAVPMEAIKLQWKDGEANFAQINVSEESIKSRQGFDEDNWPAEADSGFVSELKTGGPANR